MKASIELDMTDFALAIAIIVQTLMPIIERHM
jgi:hypothetical protein